jgi:hypothetical protein
MSDGARPFVNEEMGIKAIFPAGSRVCMGRSGDAPRGFYAWYGTREAGCLERGDLPAAFMAIGSSYNALFWTSARQAAGSCGCLSPAVARLLRGATLSIGGQPSQACQRNRKEGGVEITVYALAGEGPRTLEQNTPYVVYFATLGTRPERLRQDLASFRTFLGQLRVGSASRSRN